MRLNYFFIVHAGTPRRTLALMFELFSRPQKRSEPPSDCANRRALPIAADERGYELPLNSSSAFIGG
jgi:hypothetical protein